MDIRLLPGTAAVDPYGCRWAAGERTGMRAGIGSSTMMSIGRTGSGEGVHRCQMIRIPAVASSSGYAFQASIGRQRSSAVA